MRLSTVIAIAIFTCISGTEVSAQSCHSSGGGYSDLSGTYGYSLPSQSFDGHYSSFNSYPSYDSGFNYSPSPMAYAPQPGFYSGYEPISSYAAPVDYGYVALTAYPSAVNYAPVSYSATPTYAAPASHSAPTPTSNCANGNCSQSPSIGAGGGWSFGY